MAHKPRERPSSYGVIDCGKDTSIFGSGMVLERWRIVRRFQPLFKEIDSDVEGQTAQVRFSQWEVDRCGDLIARKHSNDLIGCLQTGCFAPGYNHND